MANILKIKENKKNLSIEKTSQFFKNVKNTNVIFFKLETAPIYETYEFLPPNLKIIWKKRHKHSFGKNISICDSDYEQLYSEKAGLYPEFAKIICISFGFYNQVENDLQLRVASLVLDGIDEKTLISSFYENLDSILSYIMSKNNYSIYAVGHNISHFDIPFLVRRSFINGIKPHNFVHESFQKPWEKFVIDTQKEWKVDYNEGDSSLQTICELLNLPNVKEQNLDHTNIAYLYHQIDLINNKFEKIANHSENRIRMTSDLFLHLQNLKTHK
jgi:hypothetical protein